ncbi:MAG: cation/H(+) antiporter [Terriglobia bacterium]|nr:MAG: cation/H(+) antiporter [Terriglobia bacterium]
MPQRKLVFAYILLVGLPILCLVAVLDAGKGLVAPPVPPVADKMGSTLGHSVTPLELSKLVLQIGVILILARVAGSLFRKINQPQVVGEMAAGILLGPSLLGWVAPGVSATLFPPASLDYLNAFSQIGLVLFMFLVGLSLNTKDLHEYGHAAVLTSHVSIAAPFCLGSVAALFLYPRLSNQGVTFTGFALFMGAAMSITAFPVLARILAERNLLRTKLGSLAIACAAVDDVTGWCVLAYIVVLIRASHGSRPLWLTLGGSLIYVILMLTGVKRLVPWFEKSYQKHGRLTDNAIAGIILLVLASALCTEMLGVHLLFGAFLLGAIMPKSADFVDHLKQKFESVTVALLLPLFFAYTGLRTSIGTITGHGMWIYTVVVLVVAVAGKLGGCLGAGKLAGMPWRDATALGVLMNTRGLMQLIILNIGLDIGVISPPVFSMMVVMALLTTFMASPLLDVVYRTPQLQAEVAAGRVA